MMRREVTIVDFPPKHSVAQKFLRRINFSPPTVPPFAHSHHILQLQGSMETWFGL